MSVITPHYRTVQQLLQSQSFAIDEYQREYKWEKKHVDEVLDLLDKFETGHREGDRTGRSEFTRSISSVCSIIVSKRNELIRPTGSSVPPR